MHHPNKGASPKEGGPGVEGTGDRQREEAQGEGYAPGTEGPQSRREQVRSSRRHFSKKMKWVENLPKHLEKRVRQPPAFGVKLGINT